MISIRENINIKIAIDKELWESIDIEIDIDLEFGISNRARDRPELFVAFDLGEQPVGPVEGFATV